MAQSNTIPVRLNGDYAAGGSPPRRVVLSQLAQSHCLATGCAEAPPVGTEVEVWIGALGPLNALVDRAEACDVSFRFRAPLDGAVLRHFACA